MQFLSKGNEPFKTKLGASIQATKLGFEKGKYEIVRLGDHAFAIESEESPMKSAEGEETETQSEVTTEVSESEPQPVTKKHVVTTPWKPSSYLNIPKHLQVPGRRYRWCTTSKPGNIEKKIAEGWVIDEDLTKKMKRMGPTIQDGTPLSTTLQVREMVVMWMPEELALGRQKYYADKSVSAQVSAKKKYQKETRDEDGRSDVYGEVKVS